jgi:hypothetical protein
LVSARSLGDTLFGRGWVDSLEERPRLLHSHERLLEVCGNRLIRMDLLLAQGARGGPPHLLVLLDCSYKSTH